MDQPGIDRRGHRTDIFPVYPAQVVKREWSTALRDSLTCPASRNCLGYLQAEVQAGTIDVWQVSDESDTLFVLTRYEQDCNDWVICLAVGTGLAKFAPLFLRVAERRGWNMRMHTVSPAVARLCRRVGFRDDPELVLRLYNVIRR